MSDIEFFVPSGGGGTPSSGTSPFTVGTLLRLSQTGLTGVRTFTFPDTTDKVTTNTAVETLTNKTIDFNQNTILNGPLVGCATCGNSPFPIGTNLSLSASGLTAVRTFTFPNLTDTVATLTATQTLTNTSLNNPTINNSAILQPSGGNTTTLIRNTGTNGTFQITNTGTGGLQFIYNNGSNVNTTSISGEPFQFNQTISTTPGPGSPGTDTAPDWPTIHTTTTYLATNLTGNPSDLAATGLRSDMVYGTNLIAPYGTVQNFTFTSILAGSGSTTNEMGGLVGWMRSDNAAIGHMWFTDWSLHGPVAAQPSKMVGISMFLNNYYNGSYPTTSEGLPIMGMSITTIPGAGAGANTTQSTAQTYPIDVGLSIAGFSGKTGEGSGGADSTTAFTKAIMIGGNASPWYGSADHSFIGTGIDFNDIMVAGLNFASPRVNTAKGIVFPSTGTAYAAGIDLSAGNFTSSNAITLGTNVIYGQTNGFKMFDTTVAGLSAVQFGATLSTNGMFFQFVPGSGFTSGGNNTNIRAMMRFYNTTEATDNEYLQIRAVGSNGYQIDSEKDNAGSLRILTLQMGGTSILTLNTDNGLAHNSTKVGFYNVAPVVQASAITPPSGGTTIDTQARTAIGSLITALHNLGITA